MRTFLCGMALMCSVAFGGISASHAAGSTNECTQCVKLGRSVSCPDLGSLHQYERDEVAVHTRGERQLLLPEDLSCKKQSEEEQCNSSTIGVATPRDTVAESNTHSFHSLGLHFDIGSNGMGIESVDFFGDVINWIDAVENEQ